MLGSVTPRIQTPPLVEGPPGPCGCGCALTDESSYGFAVVDFAELIGRPLDPWQRHVVIHAGELIDGLPRFRKVLVLVARQNGKTELCVILTLFWLFVDQYPLVLGMSTKLDYAKESWLKAIKLARKCPVPEIVAGAHPRNVRKTNGEQEWSPFGEDGPRYKIAASNAEGGRSLTLNRVIMDELRQQYTNDAWDAVYPAMAAIPDAQLWAITNQGSDRSVVLNDLYASGLSFIRSGEGDAELGLFDYSAPEGSVPSDIRALAQANPNLGRRVQTKSLIADALAAMERGGDKLKGFLTEQMCIRVRSLEPEPIPLEEWAALADPDAEIPPALAFSLFVGPDRDSWAIGVAGWLPDGRAFAHVAARGAGASLSVSELVRLVGQYKTASIRLSDGKRRLPAVVGDSWSLKPLLPDLKERGVDPFVWSFQEVAAACGGVQDGVRDKSLVHRGLEEVTAGLEGSQVRGLTNGWLWDLKKSTGDIVPLMALTLAHRALLLSEPDDSSPVY